MLLNLLVLSLARSLYLPYYILLSRTGEINLEEYCYVVDARMSYHGILTEKRILFEEFRQRRHHHFVVVFVIQLTILNLFVKCIEFHCKHPISKEA